MEDWSHGWRFWAAAGIAIVVGAAPIGGVAAGVIGADEIDPSVGKVALAFASTASSNTDIIAVENTNSGVVIHVPGQPPQNTITLDGSKLFLTPPWR